MCWVFPDRESSRTSAKWNASFWSAYVDVARELGLSWDRTTPESVTVDALDLRSPKVYIDGERVTPQDTLFVTSPYTLPYQMPDAFNQFTLYSVLEQAGFYLPHPTSFAAVGNDKLATLLFFKDSPVPPIPTVRITAGRDLLFDDYVPTIADLPYPAFVKPAGWMASRGINQARDSHDVRGLLSLAQGGDTTLVFQPDLGRRTVDFRVYVVDGRPHTTMVRTTGEGAIFPQYSTGGAAQYVDMPAELADAVAYCAERLPVPYFCADFLHDGERFWLSEIEPDGGIFCPDSGDPDIVKTQRDLIAARFDAYRAGHARMLGGAR
ncbi:hypothetical protein Lfu02_63650 [Longispora fulva]|uniref:Glutathione synthase/RimK-type ligase-like ATP-grasp enzyme n=1 Tax=Longispora fulva TaxID=619741 RepID=A0A8J7GE12_9ACTN|nr:hypothetical protein [Longispora fulva]MBG6134782.1 glutathione synthase/RimK-type ligase-like ATP-grasp enzyme [Longispora fulva]GIG61993.1 hypothetical protein Lfu02_63650 [Longispora fulva]